jgi:hypothetical protein
MPGAGLADLLAFLGMLMLAGGLALLAFAGAAGLVAACGPPGGGCVASSYVTGGAAWSGDLPVPARCSSALPLVGRELFKRAPQGTTRQALALPTLTTADQC